MGLLARRLALRNWRNFGERSIDLSPGMTILCGRNAVGKTNSVEALQLLTAGSSFRNPRPQELVREGCDRARASLALAGDGRVIDVSCDIAAGRRRYTRNDKPATPGELPQDLMSVLFNPDDLSFVKRGASYRRDELDGFARQANAGYSRLLSAYGRAVEQRNRLLREDNLDLGLLEAWDASLVRGGAALLHARCRLFERLRLVIVSSYESICPGERLACSYESSLGKEVMSLGRDELQDLFLARLEELRGEELRRGQTLIGPQRDDLCFTIDGRDARTFGSQGQQRSVVLAWKMAEVELAHQIVGQMPLLLLDDVMSELDSGRRDSMTRFVQRGIQTVVTTTNLGYFPQDLLDAAEVVSIGE